MTHDVTWLNSLSPEEAVEQLKACCGSDRWARNVASRRPFESLEQLLSQAQDVWGALAPADWLEAFRSHPKIGEQKAGVTASRQSDQWSQNEQAGTHGASEETAASLANLNAQYQDRFGYIFIVCATGKSAEEMLAILRERLENDTAVEIRTAAAEQAKITDLRLRKLID